MRKKKNTIKRKTTPSKKTSNKTTKNKKPVAGPDTRRGTTLRPTFGKRISNNKVNRKKKK